MEEQVLVLDTPKGLVLLTGCAHSGVVNICETAKKRLGKNIYGIIGGLHLAEADSERIEKTAAYFRESGIQLIGACHCTGQRAAACLAAACSGFLELTSGKIVEIG